MVAHDPTARALAARIAAHSKWAHADPVQGTAAARKAALDRFERQVDPDGVLTPSERAKRAEHARKAYFTQLALASAKARSARKRARDPRGRDARHARGAPRLAAPPGCATATTDSAATP